MTINLDRKHFCDETKKKTFKKNLQRHANRMVFNFTLCNCSLHVLQNCQTTIQFWLFSYIATEIVHSFIYSFKLWSHLIFVALLINYYNIYCLSVYACACLTNFCSYKLNKTKNLMEHIFVVRFRHPEIPPKCANWRREFAVIIWLEHGKLLQHRI